VSPRATRRLLIGHAGRPLRRISPEVAAGLYAVTPDHLRACEKVTVSADLARAALRRLQDVGWSIPALAERLRLRLDLVRGLATGEVGSCTQLVVLRIRAAALSTTSTEPRLQTPLRRAA